MTSVRPRLPASIVLFCVAVFAILVPASANADSVATTGAATNLTSSSVVLHGTVAVNADSTWVFQYGTTSSYGSYSKSAVVHAGTTQVSVTINRLMPDTLYHYRLVVLEGGYGTATAHEGEDASFTTAPLKNTIATTGGVTSLSPTSAVLNGVAHVSSNDSYWLFQYGPSSSYGHFTHEQKLRPGLTAVSARINGLVPGRTYHYRLVVAKGTSYPQTFFMGADRRFRAPLPISYGRAELRSKSLRVHKGVAAVPLACAGAKGAICAGRISLAISARRVIPCGSAKFKLRASQKGDIGVGIRSRCASLVKGAGARGEPAVLHMSFAGRQQAIVAGVRLLAA